MDLTKSEVIKLQEMIRTEGWGIYIDKILKNKKESAYTKLVQSNNEREDCRYKGKMEAYDEAMRCVGFEIEQGIK